MKRLILSITLCISAGILFFTAIFFLMYAVYLFFNGHFASPALASLLTALVFTGGALILWLILGIIKHITKSEHKRSYNNMLNTLSVTEVVKAHPGESAFIALLAGAIVGSSSNVRKKLLNMIGLTIEELGQSPIVSHALAELISKSLKDKAERCKDE